MALQLNRTVASYEAVDAKFMPSLVPAAITAFVQDAQADIGKLADVNADLLTALQLAEDFMAGFEGDELQDGIDQRLATIRSAIALAKGQ